ncbi:hypothetical protein BEH94_03670 [Candidatus Altiarchaeales archaeon WOR_SM1_SCG]|nr:hypothetical protein BEH94_03670 [Candidatus Altiarchaeales archaeon WOR_SM1_SCG]
MEYKTLEADYVEYGNNKFLEISKKKVEPDGNIFLSILKGYYTLEGEKRYQRGLGIPYDKEIVEQMIEKMRAIVSDSTASTEDAETEVKEE